MAKLKVPSMKGKDIKNAKKDILGRALKAKVDIVAQKKYTSLIRKSAKMGSSKMKLWKKIKSTITKLKAEKKLTQPKVSFKFK